MLRVASTARDRNGMARVTRHQRPHVGAVGSILQQRAAPNPGLFFFLLAKSFAKAGDAERTAHYLKLSRDDGYKDFATAEKDPEFAKVIQDPRVHEVLHVVPSYVDDAKKPTSN